MNTLYSTLNTLRDRYAPITYTSTFRTNGQITPEEFIAAGDFLVYKFPSWSWADASPTSRRVQYLPPGKQFLVTRGVPCHRRLDEHIATGTRNDGTVVRDGFTTSDEPRASDDDGWLRTGGLEPRKINLLDIAAPDENDNVLDDLSYANEEIPDMDDETDDHEAIIQHSYIDLLKMTYAI